MLERGLRDGELDEDAVGGDDRGGIAAHRHTQAPDPGELPGVPAERGVRGRLERAHQAQVGSALEARDDTRPHAAGGAGHDDVDGTTRRGRRSTGGR